MNLKLGSKLNKMTDEEILESFNETVQTMEEMRRKIRARAD